MVLKRTRRWRLMRQLKKYPDATAANIAAINKALQKKAITEEEAQELLKNIPQERMEEDLDRLEKENDINPEQKQFLTGLRKGQGPYRQDYSEEALEKSAGVTLVYELVSLFREALSSGDHPTHTIPEKLPVSAITAHDIEKFVQKIEHIFYEEYSGQEEMKKQICQSLPIWLNYLFQNINPLKLKLDLSSFDIKAICSDIDNPGLDLTLKLGDVEDLGRNLKAGNISIHAGEIEYLGSRMKGGSISAECEEVHGLGEQMKAGRIKAKISYIVEYVGTHMQGGQIELTCNNTRNIGLHMRGGEIILNGEIIKPNGRKAAKRAA